jgi:hypothetical protein
MTTKKEERRKKKEISSQSYRDTNIAVIDDNKTTFAVNAKLLDGFRFKVSHLNKSNLISLSFTPLFFNIDITSSISPCGPHR